MEDTGGTSTTTRDILRITSAKPWSSAASHAASAAAVYPRSELSEARHLEALQHRSTCIAGNVEAWMASHLPGVQGEPTVS